MKNLPLVLCGPMIRNVSVERVSCWIAVKEPCEIELSVFESINGTKGRLVARGIASTISVLPRLHISVICAHPIDENQPLNSGVRYLYDLSFRNDSVVEKRLFDERIYSLAEQLSDRIAELVYPGQDLPGFCLPSSDIKNVKFLQGSCRKPHGKGQDAFISIDKELRQLMLSGGAEPQFLMLTGDQIYADDVKPELLSMIDAAAVDLLGKEDEELTGNFGVFGDDIAPGRRKKLISRRTGFSTQKSSSHLLSLAEYFGMYLFCWSDVFWRNRNVQNVALKEFYTGLPSVRRVVANISTYMIFDDHEVTDDWNRTEHWIDSVAVSELGNRVVTNALVAYFLFQHWGNVPARFDSDGNESKVLNLLDGWYGVDDRIRDQLAAYIYVPLSGNTLNNMPNTAVSWVYTVSQSSFQVVVLDTRTKRHFDDKKGFPGLISEQAQNEVFSSLDDSIPLTVVVSAAPVLGERLIEFLQKWLARSGDGTSEGDTFDGEAWAFHKPSYNALLTHMLLLKRVIILSGDVHYAFASSLSASSTDARIVNFVASSMRNRAFGKTLSKILSLWGDRLHESLERTDLEIPVDLTLRSGTVSGLDYVEELVFDDVVGSLYEGVEISSESALESTNKQQRRKRADVIGKTNYAVITFSNGQVIQSVKWNDNGSERETLHVATMDLG